MFSLRTFLSLHTFGTRPLRSLRPLSTTARIMAQEYRLKDISSISLKNGEKQECEVEGIENGKVLLAKINDKVHAMSPNCTHYGAPLKLGVLTPDGRLTCAWHGACFNVGSGEIEDAPALDPLAKFEIFEKDGGVFIKGDEQTIKASRRQLHFKCKAQSNEKVVVVGGYVVISSSPQVQASS